MHADPNELTLAARPSARAMHGLPRPDRSAAAAPPDSQPGVRAGEDPVRIGRRALEVLRGLLPFARRHGRWFALGTLAAFMVVGARLSLPWPLRAVADRATGAAGSEALLGLVPAAIDPALAMGGLFLLLASLLGFSDYLERIAFARFAGLTVGDLRASALAGAVGERSGCTGGNAGELVSRFVADGPRVRGGMQGFLVHVATSGILVTGMTAILLGMDATLGFVFLAAGLLTLGVTAWSAARVFRHTLRQQQREAELANHLHAALEDGGGTIDAAALQCGGRSEARCTHLQGVATWSTHAIFGAAILTALAIASSAVRAGTMNAGDMVVFLMYALMLHSPIVRLARQGSKTGKVFGAAHRLLQSVPPRSTPANKKEAA
jgi:ABC-type multidrug transport system fused ATPase/permease subunit